MKKFLYVTAPLLALSIILSSCGGDVPYNDQQNKESSQEITATDTTDMQITTDEQIKPIKDYSNMETKDLFQTKGYTHGKDYKLPFCIYVPYDYDPAGAYPLVLFLHGAGERGTDNQAQLKNGIGEMFKKAGSPILDCIVVAPQCPSNEKWVNVSAWTNCDYSTDTIKESDALKAVVGLLESLTMEYSIDEDRVYATGISMGGYGTWDLLVRHGDMFAAAAPICGGCDVSKAGELVEIPIITYHGTLDKTVPPTGTQAMVDAINSAGGNKIKFTELAHGEHNIWTEVYAMDELTEWLLSHKLTDRK